MPTVQPSLFKAIGQGFLSDAYAADGNHLRWMFDPRLGFPRLAFCVEMRPSVSTEQGRRLTQHNADFRLPAGSPPQTFSVVNRPRITAARAGFSVTLDTRGAALAAAPFEIVFTGNEPYACWVRLTLAIRDPGGHVQADAEYFNRGEYEVVDRRSIGTRGIRPGLVGRRVPGHLDQLAKLLEKPDEARSRRARLVPSLQRLHARLIAADPRRFTRVSPAWLRRVARALKDVGAKADDLAPDLSITRTVEIELAAERIDRVSITGAAAHLATIRWIRSEALMADRGWKPVGCFPAATDEPDYFERNKDEFGGIAPNDLPKLRVMGPPTNGAEPLDEPLVPPVRPPTPDELDARYLTPWVEQLEPWLEEVLSKSLSGGTHQSEVVIRADLVDAGQRRGHGLPAVLSGRRHELEINPYHALLAAAASFPTARLLGLGCVLTEPGEGALDYRVRGRWLVEDVQALAAFLTRRIERALERLAEASPFNLAEAQANLAAVLAEAAETAAFLSPLIASAVDGIIELWALKIGVVPAARPLFAPPSSVAVTADGLGLPPDHAGEAVAAVRWALRQRARVIIDEDIPLGACIARGKAGDTGEFAEVRNPTDPGADRPVPLAVLPAGPAGAPGTPGTARFLDRYAEDGFHYRYGVSEMDPFGRWSPFTETTFIWEDMTPPPPPVQVEAQLDQAGTPAVLRLTMRFAWAVDIQDPTGFQFELHLRRVAPPSGDALARPHWGRCERVAGSGEGPLIFNAATTGSTSHDGMTVSIAHADEMRPDAGGGPDQHYRVWTVTFAGIVIDRDATDRAQVWAAIGSRNAKGIASTELGGPGRAEHYLTVPPPPPVFPPEPLLATFPDADNRSSFTFAWPADPSRRYVVYRAGEKELVAMAAQRGIGTAWDEDDTPAIRSAAVRAVAPLLRDAFQPVSEILPQGTASFTDGLGGSLRTLSIYTVLAHSPSMTPAAWPGGADAFVAVAVPRIPEPSAPQIVRAAWSSAAGAIDLQIAEPPPGGGPIVAFEVYRAIDPARANDWRLMRPLARMDVTPDDFADRAEGPPRIAVYTDSDVRPWTAYHYRVVARAPGASASMPGTRSEPSAVARAVALSIAPAAPASIASAVRTGTDLVVTWSAEAPANQVAPFRFEVSRTAPAPRILLSATSADAARDSTDSTLFLATIQEPAGSVATEVTVTAIDPLGRRIDSPVATVE